MDCLPKDNILEFHSNTFDTVRKMICIQNSSEMKELVINLEAWVKKQCHFTKTDFSPEYLERIIIMSKGSVERAKNRLDKLCTLRTLMPQYFDDYDVMKDFSNVEGVFTYCALPKLTSDHERVMIIKGSGRSLVNETLLEGYRYSAMMIEYFKEHDYARSYIIVNDIRAVNMTELLSKAGIVELRQIATLITDGYGLRIKGIHFLTQSKLIETLLSLLKQVVNEKIGSRLYVHNSIESLYTVIQKQILPKDYGGEECSMDELHDKWNKILSTKEFRDHWRQMSSARTDEAKRQTDKFNDQYMGMPGSFRTLSVD